MKRFETLEEVLARFHPVGVNAARKIAKVDPRFPDPVLGGRKGSRHIYSVSRVEAYFDSVDRDGFPAGVRAIIDGDDQ